MTTTRTCAVATLVALSSAGCWSTDDSQIGNDEPFRIQNAQFVEGKLVGKSIEDAGSNPPPQSDTGPPGTTSPKTTQLAYFPGQTGASFTGDTTTNAVAVGLAMDGVGTGYWVLPVNGPDPATGRLGWAATIDFGRNLPIGRRNLRVVAIDKRGRGGEQAVVSLCIKGLVPDNLQSCSPKRVPPEAVISLSWDVNADLDLQVIGPDGRLLEPKHSTTQKLMDGGAPVMAPASFDHDSNANCAGDAFRMENLVWQTERPVGRYRIYANLFDACKQPAVNFDVSVFDSEGATDSGPPHLVEKLTARGELLDISANGGSQRGLFVTEYVFR
ncbi:MAG TPA: hypothetical protein VHU80_14855 [Polyangiaceae bacterium]|jgi:hypothetical protein|nr:hypothetical protein [Polyangiaceae bacterium]